MITYPCWPGFGGAPMRIRGRRKKREKRGARVRAAALFFPQGFKQTLRGYMGWGATAFWVQNEKNENELKPKIK